MELLEVVDFCREIRSDTSVIRPGHFYIIETSVSGKIIGSWKMYLDVPDTTSLQCLQLVLEAVTRSKLKPKCLVLTNLVAYGLRTKSYVKLILSQFVLLKV